MTAVPVLNRERLGLLEAVAHGMVYRTFKGTVLRRLHGGQNRRADRAVRELVAAGWAELGSDDRTFVLTQAGSNLIGARA